MLKTSNKKIINNIFYGLVILAVLTFGVVIIPAETDAQYTNGGYVNVIPYDSVGFNNNQYYYQNTYRTPVYVEPQAQVIVTTPTIYSDSTNSSQVSNATAPKIVAKAKTTPAAKADNSNLAASVILGSNSFMPSSLVQWILFAILVLLVVILVRKIYGGNEKYQAIPMKFE